MAHIQEHMSWRKEPLPTALHMDGPQRRGGGQVKRIGGKQVDTLQSICNLEPFGILAPSKLSLTESVELCLAAALPQSQAGKCDKKWG